MKQLTFKLFTLTAVISSLFLISCESDEPKKEESDPFQPVLNENFQFEVVGNNVNFTTTITGNVWVTVNDVDYNFVDQAVSVNLPNMGTYTFTCSSLGSGAILKSDPFEVVIPTDDLSFLNEGLWKYLSGGANETKTWRLDMTADAELVHFAGPMYFSGYESEALGRKPFWAWDVLPEELPYDLEGVELTSFFNWEPDYANNTWIMAPGDYGTITFDGTNSVVTMTNITGAESSGSFTFNPETWKLNLAGVVLPIDTSRLNEPQYTDENLAALRIFSLTDSSMQIGIKRSYEGLNEDGTQAASEWTNVYNFVVVGYNYPEPEEFTYEEPVYNSFTAADLEGTWKYADVPFDWVGWTAVGNQGTTIDAVPLNGWADAAAVLATDWLGITQVQLDSAYSIEFVFEAGGNCSINGKETTYGVNAGVLTFADSVTFNVGDHWFAVPGQEFKILNVPGSEGIWIGQRNEAKFESTSVHVIKE